MKGFMRFLSKLKSSLALDCDRRPAPIRRNAKDKFTLLDDRLRETRPVAKIDSDLHFSIMRAVHSVDNERMEQVTPRIWRWAVATGATVCLALGVWWLGFRSTNTFEHVNQVDVEPMIALALNQGRELSQKAPDAAFAPLVGEMELLNRDVRSAMNLVVATMPGAASAF